ncbi:hypothetical protein LshimejAT787_1400770 [Lyophyllum shimeji]|uniref:Uncharacterized protein n=1 Tax=Lyophyllum shimeji TaxID=47721 RepID=A0A9P3PX15_LYOSH|nr:hypothetical protein LshimejAT787_1400770 [Lyophyllum shimeji]
MLVSTDRRPAAVSIELAIHLPLRSHPSSFDQQADREQASFTFFILTASGGLSFPSILPSAGAHPLPSNSLAAGAVKRIPAFLTPEIIVSLVLFVLFSGAIISLLFYGREIRSFIRRKLKRQKEPEPASELQPVLAPGLDASWGFVFDGLTQEEMDAVRRKEERQETRAGLYIKLPVSPPSLVLQHLSKSPLLPFDMDLDHKTLVGTSDEHPACMVRAASSSSSESRSGDAAGFSSSSSSSEELQYTTNANSARPQSPSQIANLVKFARFMGSFALTGGIEADGTRSLSGRLVIFRLIKPSRWHGSERTQGDRYQNRLDERIAQLS